MKYLKVFLAMFIVFSFALTMVAVGTSPAPVSIPSKAPAGSDNPASKDGDDSVASSDTVSVPIIMYHALTSKPSEISTYFIGVKTFENDLKYLKSNGYTAVTMTDLASFVSDPNGALPDKPVVLTFDDGYFNNHKYGTPLLKEHKMKAVISIIGSGSQTASLEECHAEEFSSLTWDQVGEMHDSGVWEIQNHTYWLHEITPQRKGAQLNNGESEEDYERALIADLSLMQGKILETTGTAPNTFTWPFGAISDEADDALRALGFKATLSCYHGVNQIKKGDPKSLFHLKRNLRTPTSTLSDLLE